MIRERGVAMFTAMMLIMLISGVSLFVLQNAATEKMIAAYVKREAVSLSLAEAGIEQAIYWMAYPDESPQNVFFSKRKCDQNDAAFSSKGVSVLPAALRKGEGDVTLSIYHEKDRPNGRCTVKSIDATGKAIRIDLAPPPIPKMPAAVVGPGSKTLDQKGQIKWCDTVPCSIEETNPPNPKDVEKLKSFIKRYGRFLTLSEEGDLEGDGVTKGESFQQIFSVSDRRSNDQYDMVYIDSVFDGALPIGPGPYRGYFYFTGDIKIEGSDSGSMEINTVERPLEELWSPLSKTPDYVNLDGLFYTPRHIILNKKFQIHGALYAGLGIAGDLNSLYVWYNDRFTSGDYPGVVPMVRVPGTWEAM